MELHLNSLLGNWNWIYEMGHSVKKEAVNKFVGI